MNNSPCTHVPIVDVQVGDQVLAYDFDTNAIDYIRELRRKYEAGSTIASTNSVPTNLRRETLQGQQYLEVPVQNQPIPQAVLDFANAQERRVIIRDVAGREYN